MSTVQHFPEGSLITSTATFAPTAGDDVPATVVVKVSLAGVATTYTYPDPFITQVSDLIYSAEIDTTGSPGPGVVLWDGHGGLQAVNWAEWFTDAAPL